VNAFRRMNLVIGYSAADRLLAEVGKRAAAVSPGALVGRVGDDEFALFALDLRNSDEAKEVARLLEQALTFEHMGVSVRVSVGYAVFPRDANGAEALWLAADNALAESRQHPRSRPGKPA
jgi:diguanylate cyclase (GGDEF)-like protein